MQPLQTVKSETLADLLIKLVRNFEKRLIRPLSKSFIKRNRSHSLWIIRNKTFTVFLDQNQL